jgi:predicted acyl esterase
MKQVTWAFNQAKESPLAKANASVRAALDAEDLIEWFKAMPWKPGHSPVRWVPEYENYLFEQWTHGAFDDYWKQLGIYAEGYYKQFADVPQIHMSSWYDAYVRTAIDNYTALRKKKRGPVRLIMGPWTHGDRCKTFSGDVDFGAGRDHRQQPGRALARIPPALVRSLDQRSGQRASTRNPRSGYS